MMNATRKFLAAATIAAVGFGMAVASTPATAAIVHGGGGAFHGGGSFASAPRASGSFGATAAPRAGGYGGGAYGGNWNRGWHGGGWWGPGVIGGLAAGAFLGSEWPYGYYNNGCYQLQPSYNIYGQYVGQQWTNVCD
jgi:hypothetical protein